MGIKRADLPAEAIPLPDGRYFIPLKPRDKPKQSPPVSNSNWRALEDMDEDEVLSLHLATSTAARIQPPNQVAMPTKDAPPIQYGQQITGATECA